MTFCCFGACYTFLCLFKVVHEMGFNLEIASEKMQGKWMNHTYVLGTYILETGILWVLVKCC